MGGSSCLGFSFIEFKLKWLEHRFRACGLRPQLVHLDTHTAIHCWLPSSSSFSTPTPQQNGAGGRGGGVRDSVTEQEEEGKKKEEEKEEAEEEDPAATAPDNNNNKNPAPLENKNNNNCSKNPASLENKKHNNNNNNKADKNKKAALILLHGFAPNALLCWENQIAAFAKEFDVYVPDLLFFGNSSTQLREKRWSEAFQAECVMRMLQLLGVVMAAEEQQQQQQQQKKTKKTKEKEKKQQQQQEVFLLGTSYGGMVAFRMAEFYPDLVHKVVFSSSGICMAPGNDERLVGRHNLSEISQLLLPSSAKHMRIALASATHKPLRIPDFVVRDFVQVLYEDNRAERKQLLEHMVFGKPEAFPLPPLTQEKFLVVWGEHDEIFNISLAYELQKHLGTSRAEMAVMKNCGHAPQFENPKEYNRIILNFLQSHPEKKSTEG